MLVIPSYLEPVIIKDQVACVEGGKMARTGEKPGKGKYDCNNCWATLMLDDDTDTLPPCPSCDNVEFHKLLDIPDDLLFTMTAKHSGQAVDVFGRFTDPGTSIVQATFHGLPGQQFHISKHNPSEPEWHYITAMHSGQNIAVAGVLTHDGANVIQWPYTGGNEQMWKIRNHEREWVSLAARHGEQKSLSVEAGSTEHGANIVQYEDIGVDSQRFKFSLVNPHWDVKVEQVTPAKIDTLPGDYGVDILSERLIINDSAAILTERIESIVSRECTFRWSFKTFFSIGISFGIEVELPFCGSAKTDVNVQAGFETTQEWEKKVTRSYSVSRDVTLAGKQAVKVGGVVDWVNDYQSEFDLKLRLAAVADCWNRKQYDPNHPEVDRTIRRWLTRSELIRVLEIYGFEGTFEDGKDSDTFVVAQIAGKYSGSFGTVTTCSVKEMPIPE